MNLFDYILSRTPVADLTNQTKQAPVDPQRLGPKEVYFTWEAEGRPVQKMSNIKLNRSFAVIGVVIVLFLVVLQEYFLILVVASLIFVSQVLTKTPPEKARYELSSYGVLIDEKIYYWNEMSRYFNFNQEDHLGFAIDLINSIPSRLFLSVTKETQTKVNEILGSRLQFLQSIPESFLDRTYKSVTSKFNV